MKILLQKAVAGKGTAWIGEQGLGVTEASGLEMGTRKRDGMLPRVGCAVAKQNLRAVVAKQFIQGMSQAALSAQVKAQRAQFQFFESNIGKAFELETQGGDSILGLDCGTKPVRREPLSGGDFQRPESGIETSFELAGVAVHRLRVKHRIARNGEASAKFSLFGIEMKLHDGGRWNGADVMRVKNAEQRFGDFRELVVDLEMDARSQIGEGFDEAFDVRIFAAVGIEQETRGDLWIFLGELRAHLAQIG